ncbi:hypothetical protein RCC89_10650 [Cytophagaceae bacterium ABcell3]|nr:hypothetical protein RCC89_10650 [Cytophagaceae bacterium ABcell3]
MKFNTDKNSAILNKGDLLSLEATVRHSVKAIEDTAFLLTIASFNKTEN